MGAALRKKIASSSSRESIPINPMDKVRSIEEELIGSMSILVIGANHNGDLGLGHTNAVDQLTVLMSTDEFGKDPNVKIHSGCMFSIFSIDNRYIFSAGLNGKGELALNSKNVLMSTPNVINFFAMRRLNVLRVCTNPSSSSVFWITDNQNVYANGCNESGQLGISGLVTNNQYSPTFVTNASNVLDMQSTATFSIALCGYCKRASMILEYWSRNEKIFLPNDMMNSVIMFYGFEQNKVLYTQQKEAGVSYYGDLNGVWREVKGLGAKDIFSIRAGDKRCIFLAAAGVLYTYNQNSPRPFRIRYFENKKILIQRIECGGEHALALDDNGYVYMLCLSAKELNPTRIDLSNVVDLKCGYNHFYCKTSDERHFLFGNNVYNECLTFDSSEFVNIPHCINDVVKKATNGRAIKSVFLGYENTKIIV